MCQRIYSFGDDNNLHILAIRQKIDLQRQKWTEHLDEMPEYRVSKSILNYN